VCVHYKCRLPTNRLAESVCSCAPLVHRVPTNWKINSNTSLFVIATSALCAKHCRRPLLSPIVIKCLLFGYYCREKNDVILCIYFLFFFRFHTYVIRVQNMRILIIVCRVQSFEYQYRCCCNNHRKAIPANATTAPLNDCYVIIVLIA
jgi:hypothetical protein